MTILTRGNEVDDLFRLSFSAAAEIPEQWAAARRAIGVQIAPWQTDKPGTWKGTTHPNMLWQPDKREEEHADV